MATASNGDFECRQDRVTSGQSIGLRTDVDGIKNEPVNGSGAALGTAPHLVMSPVSPTGLPTMGAQLSIATQSGGIKVPAVPAATGFVVTVWVRNAITYTWSKMAPMTFATAGASDTRVLFVTEDLDASELYFQVAAASVAGDGWIDFMLVEL